MAEWTVASLEVAKRSLVEKERTSAVAGAVSDDIELFNVRVSFRRNTPGSTDFVINSDDPEFDAVFTVVKAVAERALVKATADFEATAVAMEAKTK